MVISRIETIPVSVPLKPELVIRSGRGGSHTSSPFLLVKVHTDEGVTGIGEASCTPRWSGEDQVTGAHLIHTYLEPLLRGQDPLQLERLTQSFRLAFAGNYFTKSAVEMALWDIAGKVAGKPVWQLLGGKIRGSVPTKWSVSGVEPDKAAAIGARAVGQGFKAMKVKVGLDPGGDVARVAAVREAIGAGIKLGVDANGGWQPDTALATITRLYENNIAFVEQPLAPDELVAMANMRSQLRVPLIADESVYGLGDAKVIAQLKAADALSIYIGKAGGIEPARQIAEFAASAGMKCTVGSNLELGVGSAAMVHLALATAGIAAEEFPCDIIGPFYYEHDIVREPLPIKPGEAHGNERPGLGVELDEEKVERYRVRGG
ncbi:MAG: mandelate racemase/muconate lactonizing protein [Verrucomicrobia bacterium]|nr:MAG: mandelate racemase/muconate lactonizing protein [Verrucomicrobiota bacterium]